MTTTTTMPGCYVGCTPPALAHAASVAPPTTYPPPHLVAHAVGQLPFTGGDVLQLLALASVLIAVGVTLVRWRRAAR